MFINIDKVFFSAMVLQLREVLIHLFNYLINISIKIIV